MAQKKIVIYQVFPRLFGNNQAHPVANGTLAENGGGKFSDFTPQALSEIKKLGCTHIWYTGVIEHATQTDYSAYGIVPDNPYVVKGKAGSPYAIKDYYDVDPDLADDVPNRMTEFEALVKRSQEQSLRVIIDFVPNHVARQYHSDAKPAGVIDLGEKDDNTLHFNSQNNFYYIPRQELMCQFDVGEGESQYTEYPAKVTGNDCFGAYPARNDWYETVKLNYGVDYMHGHYKHFDPIPDTWLKMRDILLFWASKGIDGFRCDMAEMVPVEFWGWVIPLVKKTYPHLLFIAEVYNPNEYHNYIYHGKFDYLYDKVGLYDLLRNIIAGYAPASQITYSWQSLHDIQSHMLNFLENHDEQRIASDYFSGCAERAKAALVVAATLNTNPFMIYAGQELGERGMDEEGFSGRDGRTTIFDYWRVDSLQRWYNEGHFDTKNLTPAERKLRSFYQKIIKMCNREATIREGSFFDLMYVNEQNPAFNIYKQYTYLRKYENELLIIAVNFDNHAVGVQINIPQHAFDVMKIPFQMQQVVCEELITGVKCSSYILPTCPFETNIESCGAVIWKVKWPATKTKTKKKQITL